MAEAIRDDAVIKALTRQVIIVGRQNTPERKYPMPDRGLESSCPVTAFIRNRAHTIVCSRNFRS